LNYYEYFDKFKNIRYTLGRHSLADFKNRDLIIRAPGTPLDSLYIIEADKNNIPITFETVNKLKMAMMMEICEKIDELANSLKKEEEKLPNKKPSKSKNQRQ
jgi:UDP-N-acetylmuramoylalanine-D-glutamate ligase